jgi:predicted cobalt transporter CbtA
VAIALGAVAALTRRKTVWLGSITMGAVGIALFVQSFLP